MYIFLSLLNLIKRSNYESFSATLKKISILQDLNNYDNLLITCIFNNFFIESWPEMFLLDEWHCGIDARMCSTIVVQLKDTIQIV